MNKGSVLTIGSFDGVHLGHRKIFHEVVRRAKRLGLTPAALTFALPPRLFFFPSNEPALLSTLREKIELMKACGIKKIHVLKFDAALARVSARDFFDKYILGLCNAKEVVVGYNFGFGRNREGDSRFLEESGRRNNIGIYILPPVVNGSVPASSGRIRQALREGNLARANSLLGVSYTLTGKVVMGRKLGRKLGFPTANLKLSPEKIVPLGVFAVRATLPGGRELKGMANYGRTRTFEVHLFGFSGNLYGKTLQVRLIRKIRDEKAFTSLHDLSHQLEKDGIKARKMLQ